MLYGPREYGGGKYCPRCGSYRWRVAENCYFCGEPGCDQCMTWQEDSDSSVGYFGGRLVCSNCETEEKDDEE